MTCRQLLRQMHHKAGERGHQAARGQIDEQPRDYGEELQLPGVRDPVDADGDHTQGEKQRPVERTAGQLYGCPATPRAM